MSDASVKRPGVPAVLMFLFFIFIGTGVVVWVKLTVRPSAYRDPARMRFPMEYDRMMDREFSNLTSYEEMLGAITVETNGPGIAVKMALRPDMEDYADHTRIDYHHVESGEVLELPEGKIWINDLLVAYGEIPPEKVNDPSVDMPGRIFNAELQELTGEDDPAEYGRVLAFLGEYPAVRFDLKSEFTEDVKVIDFRAFDARTHKRVDQDFSVGDLSSTNLQVSMNLQLWHNTPIELVADIAFGPPETLELPIKFGAKVEIPGGVMMLLAAAENSTGTSSSTGTSETLIRINTTPENENFPVSTMIFSSLPVGRKLPVDVEFLDEQRRTVTTASLGGTTSPLLYQQYITAQSSAIKTVRATNHFPHRKRLVFHLHGIPGLPEANQNIEDLFDVRVSYVRFRGSPEIRQWIANMIQSEVIVRQAPTNRFAGPKVFKNVTVREVAEVYTKFHGPAYGAQIDQENMTIEFVDRSLKTQVLQIWEEVKNNFR